MSEARRLRELAERLCAVATGTEAEIRMAAAMPLEPAPLGARACHVRPGALSRANVRLEYSPGVFTRADLDAALGTSQSVLGTVPTGTRTLAYRVIVPDAPAMISVYASFLRDPDTTAVASSLLLRIDPAQLIVDLPGN
jgi:hypothetical protein